MKNNFFKIITRDKVVRTLYKHNVITMTRSESELLCFYEMKKSAFHTNASSPGCIKLGSTALNQRQLTVHKW